MWKAMHDVRKSNVGHADSDSSTVKKARLHTFKLIDLKLDARLKPLPFTEFVDSAPPVSSSEQLASSLVKDKAYCIGSGSKNDHIYFPGDLGLFGCIFEAWKNHWTLRTCPEDWWGPIACKIAKAINDGAKQFNKERAKKVRDLFVDHDGKENITVSLPSYSVDDSNYELLFSSICAHIEEKIKVPKYAQAMQNDFESSGPAHKIASQINLMAGMQQFFEYQMNCCGCGLRGLEMVGDVKDWDCLVTKLEEVRKILLPIQDHIRLSDEWWKRVLYVFTNLANTRKHPDDPAVAKFWINILMDTTDTAYIGGGGSRPGKPVQVEAYDGWLVLFLTGRDKIQAKVLTVGGNKQLSGWNQVPMQVRLTWCNPPIQEEATLVAGILGYKVHPGDQDVHSESKDMEGERVHTIEPNHMWAMLLSPQSKLRGRDVDD